MSTLSRLERNRMGADAGIARRRRSTAAGIRRACVQRKDGRVAGWAKRHGGGGTGRDAAFRGPSGPLDVKADKTSCVGKRKVQRDVHDRLDSVLVPAAGEYWALTADRRRMQS
ncbi:hypothetical protein FA95DRAFT_1003588 [Auriscalpium vulgare]|uniref:Uncharacterized protein n=1 Tax=Auriscalpium vulgare TaxID=40419 RepID=A0ACB8R767_9AGAM|nr:hypothetical protein FA95DRAFT_1003588 [Auriscalpium vulgare]